MPPLLSHADRAWPTWWTSSCWWPGCCTCAQVAKADLQDAMLQHSQVTRAKYTSRRGTPTAGQLNGLRLKTSKPNVTVPRLDCVHVCKVPAKIKPCGARSVLKLAWLVNHSSGEALGHDSSHTSYGGLQLCLHKPGRNFVTQTLVTL